VAVRIPCRMDRIGTLIQICPDQVLLDLETDNSGTAKAKLLVRTGQAVAIQCDAALPVLDTVDTWGALQIRNSLQ